MDRIGLRGSQNFLEMFVNDTKIQWDVLVNGRPRLSGELRALTGSDVTMWQLVCIAGTEPLERVPANPCPRRTSMV